jgi:diaminopimelate decarboxylase
VYLPYHSTPQGLFCDGVSVQSIVERVGTPAYVYSARAVREAYRAIDEAFAGYPHHIHYALKANSTLALLRLLRSLGSRADVNSGGEMAVAMRAGFDPKDIVFTGVGKTREEIEEAITKGVGTINAESAGELDRIAAAAKRMGRTARVALRVNPDIDAKSHPNISTGLRTNKFGVPVSEARGIYQAHRTTPGLQFVGLHIHIGSQITTGEPLQRAASALVGLALDVTEDGFSLEHVDLGGGLGISYEGPAPSGVEGRDIISPAQYASLVLPELKRIGLPVVLEPGRAIVGHSGALVARVVDTKQFPDGRRFRRDRCGHDGTDASRALRVVSPHRARRSLDPGPSRRATSWARSVKAATSSPPIGRCPISRSTISSRCSIRARMAR